MNNKILFNTEGISTFIRNMRADLFIGIDGGASKTAAILCDATGRVHARARGNCGVIGPTVSPVLGETLRSLSGALLTQAGVSGADVRGWALGLSGVDFVDEHAAQRADVARVLDVTPSSKLTLVNDGIVALWGASASPAAAILQHGSGVTAAWRDDYGREQLFDHLNVGQLFDIREQLLPLVARMIDGREEPTSLLPGTLEHLGVSPEHFANRLYRRQLDANKLRSTPPLIYDSWLAGDPAADRLVQAAVADYALLATTLAHRTGSPKPEIVFGGGVINVAPPAFLTALDSAVRRHVPGAVIRRPLLPPEFGAAALAAFKSGCGPHALLEAWRPYYSTGETS